jgi:hypothetical protein
LDIFEHCKKPTKFHHRGGDIVKPTDHSGSVLLAWTTGVEQVVSGIIRNSYDPEKVREGSTYMLYGLAAFPALASF